MEVASTDGEDAGTTSEPTGGVFGWSCVGQDPVTGEVICAEVPAEADGTCDLVCDGNKASDGTTVKILIVATYGTGSSSLAALDLTDSDDTTLAKYFEAPVGSTEFEAGDVDFTGTLSLLVGTGGGTTATGCGVAYRQDLFGNAELGGSGTEGGLAAIRAIAECLAAKYFEGTADLSGYSNPLALASDLVNGRMDAPLLTSLITQASQLCNLTESELEKASEAVTIMPDLWDFADQNVVADSTSCEKVRDDAEEREAWVGVVYALDADPAVFEGNTQEAIVETIRLARQNEDYSALADPNRARILTAAFSRTALEGTVDTARLETMLEMTRQIDLTASSQQGIDYTRFGEAMVQTIWDAGQTTLESYQEQASQVGNYLWGEYMEGSLTAP